MPSCRGVVSFFIFVFLGYVRQLTFRVKFNSIADECHRFMLDTKTTSIGCFEQRIIAVFANVSIDSTHCNQMTHYSYWFFFSILLKSFGSTFNAHDFGKCPSRKKNVFSLPKSTAPHHRIWENQYFHHWRHSVQHKIVGIVARLSNIEDISLSHSISTKFAIGMYICTYQSHAYILRLMEKKKKSRAN